MAQDSMTLTSGRYSKKRVSVAACLSIFLFGTGLITLGAVAPELKQRFLLDDMSAGTLFSILPLGILTGSLLFGPIADRFGYRLLLSVSCLLMFVGFEGIAFSDSMILLKLAIFCFGTGGGAINGATSAVVADISEQKGAALNILGVFFGLGALTMPFMLGIFQNIYSFTTIVSVVGFVTLGTATMIVALRFPPPKQNTGFKLIAAVELMREGLIVRVAFFLFCQSSFEGIINNWTTSYLTVYLGIPANKALYGLSLYLAGMTGMRLLLGTVLKSISVKRILFVSFVMIGSGCVLLQLGEAYILATVGLVLIGAGFGGGFPVMLGLLGSRYAQLSGTAFGIVLTVALAGNILVNYGMGIIVQQFGIQHLVTVSYVELGVMILLSAKIIKKL